MQLPNRTNTFIRLLKPLFPERFRIRLRKFHQKGIFKKALRDFRMHYREIEQHPKIINDLIYGWGNMGWSSFQDYTYAIIKAAKQNHGPVLECGSGLSTLILGIIAEDRGFEVWSLEHHESWAAHVKKHLAEQHINKVHVCYAPLKTYGEYQWYDKNNIKPSQEFSLVICDGPPHDTKGGRYGLLPLMHEQMADQSILLLDDYIREEEKSIVDKWQNDFQLQVSANGDNDLYALIILTKINTNKFN